MPKGGHNRKSTKMKKRLGTYRPSREGNKVTPPSEPTFIGEPPPDLELNASEKKAWKFCAEQAQFIYEKEDRLAFILLVRMWAKFNDRKEKLSDTAYSKLIQSLSTLLQQFGMTPASRQRVGRGGGSGDDDSKKKADEAKAAEDFIFGKPKLVAS